jgi:hypothetical protein
LPTHHFEPTHYHTAIGSHKPVLRIADGDTVITTTVDARGQDASGERVTPRGNPQTGPFYVEGAEPGDTLVIELDRLVPSRTYGFTRTMVAPNVVDPDYVPQLPWPLSVDQELAEWYVDAEAWKATLVAPDEVGQARTAAGPDDRLLRRRATAGAGHLLRHLR